MDPAEELRKMLLGVSEEAASLIPPAERRKGDRFPIIRDLCYKVLSRRGAAIPGCGKTINISSTGVLFSAPAPIDPGKRVELSIDWPVQLDGNCGLKLVALGHVIRCKSDSIAVEIDSYEFRTRGSKGIGPSP